MIGRLRTLDRLFRPIALTAGCTAIVLAVYAERDGIESYPWRLSWLAFAGAALLFAAGPFAGAAAFHIVLNDLTGGRTPRDVSLKVWLRAFLARYVPSGALTMAVRLRARGELGATRRQIWEASILEQLVAAIGGAAAATAAFALAGEDVPRPATVVLAVGLILAVGLRHRGAIVRASALAAGSWVVPGAAACLVLNGLTDARVDPFYVAGAYALAWVLGFLVVLAPSGLGVREAAFVAFLQPAVGTGPALLVAVAVRLANTLGDLLAFAAAEAAAFMIPSDAPFDRAPAASPVVAGRPGRVRRVLRRPRGHALPRRRQDAQP